MSSLTVDEPVVIPTHKPDLDVTLHRLSTLTKFSFYFLSVSGYKLSFLIFLSPP